MTDASNYEAAFKKMIGFLEKRTLSEILNPMVKDDANFLINKMDEFLGETVIESQLGQSPEKDNSGVRGCMDAEYEPDLSKTPEEILSEKPELDPDTQLALAKSSVEAIELRGTITKYRTFYDDEQTEPRGWLIKLLDVNDQETDEGNEWLCRILVKWIQELPLEISSRDEKNKRDRSYPSKFKRSIYVNDSEMAYIEELAKEQEILVQEKEFNRQ